MSRFAQLPVGTPTQVPQFSEVRRQALAGQRIDWNAFLRTGTGPRLDVLGRVVMGKNVRHSSRLAHR